MSNHHGHRHPRSPEPSREAIEAGVRAFWRVVRRDMMFGECSRSVLHNLVLKIWQAMYEVEAAEAPPDAVDDLTVTLNESPTHGHHHRK